MPKRSEMRESKLYQEVHSKGEQTRERIVQAGLFCFSKQGYHGTSVQAIADRVGLSQAAVLKHFKSKLGLFSAIFNEVVRGNHDLVEAQNKRGEVGIDALKAHCLGNLEWAAKRPDQASILLHLYYLSSVDQDFFTLYLKVRETGRQRVERFLLEENRELFRDKMMFTKISQTIHEALIGFIVNLVATREYKSPAEVKRTKEKMIFLIERLIASNPQI